MTTCRLARRSPWQPAGRHEGLHGDLQVGTKVSMATCRLARRSPWRPAGWHEGLHGDLQVGTGSTWYTTGYYCTSRSFSGRWPDSHSNSRCLSLLILSARYLTCVRVLTFEQFSPPPSPPPPPSSSPLPTSSSSSPAHDPDRRGFQAEGLGLQWHLSERSSKWYYLKDTGVWGEFFLPPSLSSSLSSSLPLLSSLLLSSPSLPCLSWSQVGCIYKSTQPKVWVRGGENEKSL